MGRNNGSVPGTFVSNKEMNELGQLLTTFREYIVSHEARLDGIEEWISEFHKANIVPGEEATSEAVKATEGATIIEFPLQVEEVEGDQPDTDDTLRWGDESPNDPEEG